MKTFFLPAATIILSVLYSCTGAGRNRKEVLEGKWNVDSIHFKQDTVFESISFRLFVLNDSTIPDLEFRKDTFFVFMGAETDTLRYTYHQHNNKLIVNEQDDQPYHVIIQDEKTVTLVMNDSDVFFIKKL